MTPTLAFGPNPGALKMLTYRPRRGGKGLPLVVVLHGCAQSAETFARQAGWLALADRYGFVVVAAEQSGASNPNRCFNWFEPQDSRRGEGEAASIAAMVAHAVRTQGVDPKQVYVTGLSAGGAMTAVMLVAYPEVFAGGAVVAGLLVFLGDSPLLGPGRGRRTGRDGEVWVRRKGGEHQTANVGRGRRPGDIQSIGTRCAVGAVCHRDGAETRGSQTLA
jgi:poly(3-hydroxybutyrate) depolymerase